MALQPGTRLGPYEIVELAGAGGMGEVYKARDTRLERTVAVKVLPPHASASADLKQRFEREAQTIASLKHPHICVLHDIGSDGGTDFIVMEYLQGETLADRLARGKGRGSGATAAGTSKPASGSSGTREASRAAASKSDGSAVGRALKLEEALAVAMQIADALDQAHQHGVVHRDLKPANVMLLSGGGTPSGTPHVKLLDFGLAKLTAPVEAMESADTIQADLTGPGMILGTMRYMAPEQVEGRNADARTDIFAFGVVLYEMLTGRKAFDGKSQPSLIAAIMNVDPPPLSALLPIAPRALERLVTRCLAKDPDDRWQTAHDLLIQLRWIARGGVKPGTARDAHAGVRAKREWWTLAAIAAGLLITAGMALPAFRFFQGPAEPDEFRFRVPAVGMSQSDFAVSPDGETIALVARSGPDAPSLYVRPVNAVTFKRLAGTESAAQPFWSPDSSTIGFVAGGRLKKVAASGTPPQEIGTVEGVFFGGTWNKDGTILFGSAAGVRRISAEGGTSDTITTVEKPASGHYWPHFLPDGQHYLYLAWAGEVDKRAVFVGSLASKDATRLLAADSNAEYAPGYVVFRRDATVLAQPFDAERLTLSGGPVQIAGDIAFSTANGRGFFSVSQRGTLIYFNAAAGAAGASRARVTPNWQFGWHDRTGRLLTVAGEPGSYGDIDLSPDGKLIAVTRQDAGAAAADIWVIDWQRGVSTKLTLDGSDDMNPVWSPDGARIAFTTFRKGNADVFIKNASGVGPETPLLDSAADEYVEDWSKDGRHLVYRFGQGEFEDLYVLPFDTEGKPGKPFPVVQGNFQKEEPQFSYDGKWLAYGSNESGTFEIYVTSFPALDQKLKISDGGGGRPRWRRDSKELFYMRLQSGVMAADFAPGPKIGAGTPHLLYTSGATGADPSRHLWSVAPDGDRILMRTFAGTGGAVLATAQPNFTAAQGAPPAAGFQVPAPAAAASNGLTVVRHWTAAFRKATK